MIINASATHIPLRDESVHCVVTSPPYYGLRRYKIPDSIWDGEEWCEHQWDEILKPAANGIVHNGGMSGETLSGSSATRKPQRSSICSRCGAWKGQLGGEPSISLYVSHLVQIFREVRRVLRSDGVLWLNLGDSYASGKGSCHNPGGGERSLGKHLKNAGVHYLQRSDVSDLRRDGLKPKDLYMVPARVALALQEDGWYLRSAIPWIKRNCMPESVNDRPTVAVEYIFLLTKSPAYFYDAESIKIGAAEDTHARYARGRGTHHKWSDGGPGNQTIARGFDHMINMPDNYKGGIPGRKDGPGQDRRSQRDRLPGVHPKSAEPETGIRANSSFNAAVKDVVGSRNRRNSDWFFESLQGLLSDEGESPLAMLVNSRGFSGQHFSTFPEAVVEPCIKAGTSAKGCCRKCGAPWERVVEKEGLPFNSRAISKRYQEVIKEYRGETGLNTSIFATGVQRESATVGWRATCSCDAIGVGLEPSDLEIILSPTGERSGDDPSMVTGRAGYNRPRGDNEGGRPTTRYEQRQYATQLRNSPYREEMSDQAGEPFAHYIRIDRGGARPVPRKLLEDWIGKGWIERVEVPRFEACPPSASVVLDPFSGSGTVGAVAERLGRRWVGLDLGYQQLQKERLAGIQKEIPLIG